MSTIKFGIRSVKLKSYSLQEFGLSNEENSKLRVEYRQNYFHLHFIPLFPTSKVLRLRKEDNQLYELPHELISQIKHKIEEKPKTPWYTYLGPIVLVIGLSIYFGKIMLEDYNRRQHYKTKFETKGLENIELLEQLNTDDFIKLRISKPWVVQGKFIKVEKINKDSILIKKMFTDLSYKESASHLIKSYYLENKDFLDSTWIHKNMLRKAICTDYDSISQKSEFGIDFFNENEAYLIDGIERIDNGPIIKSRGTGSYGKKISMALHNYGAPCNIIKIENLQGNINWTNKLPYFLKTNNYDQSFYLRGNNYETDSFYDFILYLETLDGKVFKYRFEGKNLSPKISRVKETVTNNG